MQIFIPSMRRELLQYTLKEILPESPFPIYVVCPFDEYDAYRQKIPAAVKVFTPPQNILGIAATRQWIMEGCSEFGSLEHGDAVVMMDDDLTFATRRWDDPTKFREPEAGEIKQMLVSLEALLLRHAHAGIATREGANRNTEEVLSCTRAPRVIGYRRSVFLREGVDFRQSEVMDDFEATLFLLTHGYPNAVLNSFVQNQKGSGTKGGASTYRDMAMHQRSAEKLASRYPKFVKTVRKQTKTAWGGQERTDVIIQWKRALEHGRALYGDRNL